MSESPHININSSEFIADPFPVYQRMRGECPFHRATFSNGEETVLVTKFDDVMTILKDDERFTVDMAKIMPPEIVESFLSMEHVRILTRMMLTLDGDDHRRLRRLMQKAFAPRMIELLGPRIQQITDELLDNLSHKHEMDLVSEFAFPIPIQVISEMVGVPLEDRPRFLDWADQLMKMGDSLEGLMASEETVKEFSAYFRTQFAIRRENPTDDLMTALAQVEVDGIQLTEAELISMVMLILVAGYETTGNLIANSVLSLLQHPDQMALLRSKPELIDAAVEEFLRFNSAVQTPAGRWALEEVQVGDFTFEKGDAVAVILGSANRDEAYYEQSEQFDITRPPTRHLAFGHGVHFCLGAPLARLETKIAINTILRRLPNLQLVASTPEWKNDLAAGGLLRSLKRLPVTY